jgi:Zinc knuckle
MSALAGADVAPGGTLLLADRDCTTGTVRGTARCAEADASACARTHMPALARLCALLRLLANGLAEPKRNTAYHVSSARRCFRCGMPGHMARECTNQPKAQLCSRCASYGHHGDGCPNGARLEPAA